MLIITFCLGYDQVYGQQILIFDKFEAIVDKKAPLKQPTRISIIYIFESTFVEGKIGIANPL